MSVIPETSQVVMSQSLFAAACNVFLSELVSCLVVEVEPSSKHNEFATLGEIKKAMAAINLKIHLEFKILNPQSFGDLLYKLAQAFSLDAR